MNPISYAQIPLSCGLRLSLSSPLPKITKFPIKMPFLFNLKKAFINKIKLPVFMQSAWKQELLFFFFENDNL
jgi:hypothetical protein